MRCEQLASLLCALVIGLVGTNTVLAATGRTVGSFAVSSSGAATYTIPIWTPPGPHGLQPHLALAYNSQAGNGYLGVGWSLAGLSTIYRCNKTYAQDEAPAAVALSTSDGYCMDGQRLRLTSGTYGVAGSTYQTEIANFANVTAYGSYGNGPAYFVVQQKNGLIYEYGNPANDSYAQVEAGSSGTASAWMLDKISDRAGNTMIIDYEPPSSNNQGETVPLTISWTPTSYGASTYSYTVNFQYTPLSVAPSAGYLAGTPEVNYYLMTGILIDYDSNVVKNYELGYTTSNTTERETLTSITECADVAGANCLAPTDVQYQSGQAGVGSGATVSAAGAITSGSITTHGDFNGDGITDLAWYAGGQWQVSFGTSNGYSSPINTGITKAGTLLTNVLVDSVDGTGTSGFLVPISGVWWYYKWNGSSFAGSSTGVGVDSGPAALADVNGDGLPDLVSQTGNYIYVRLNTSTSGSVSFASTRTSTYYYVGTTATVNLYSYLQPGTGQRPSFGGGAQDVFAVGCGINSDGDEYCWENALEYNNGTGQFTAIAVGGLADDIVPIDASDFNDDGCADALTSTALYISACNGSPASTISFDYSVIGAMDWDGDGRKDVLVAYNGDLGVYKSTGTGFSSLIDTGIVLAGYSSNDFIIHNAAGDGEDAVAVNLGSSIEYYLHSSTGQPPDLLTNVTDGYGNYAQPTYYSLSQYPYYVENWNTATYPYQTYIGSLYVVGQVSFSDPSNPPSGYYSRLYTYCSAWQNLQGRGFAGFGAINAQDSRNSVVDSRRYEQSFPYTGLTWQEYTFVVPSDATWLEATATPAYTVLSSTQYQQRYFPYFSNWTKYRWEYGGTENSDLITTSSSSYTYDDYGNATTVVTTTTDNDPGSPYSGDSWTTSIAYSPDVDGSNQNADLDAWCLGLNDSAVITYSSTLSGSNTVTRTTDFTPDSTASNCRIVTKITEPDSSAYKVTESFVFDSFGNVNSDAVTGVNMTARATTVNWDTTGQLPVKVTDPTGQVTQLDYDYSYGLISSLTDPNGLTKSWQYSDGFARKTKETRPDGTYTTWVYTSCDQISQCDIGSNTPSIEHYFYNTDGSLESAGTINYDAADRPYLASQLVASSQVQRRELRYDSLGRVSKRAAPCFWTSATTPCPYWMTYTYDAKNRLTAVQHPISQNDSTLQTTTYAYAGDTETITDPNDYATTLIRDVNGWMRETKDPYRYTVTTAYDAAGSKTGVTDGLGHTLWSGTWAYGIVPFNTEASDADLGTWNYTYDALGERIGWTDAKGQSFGESYDALGRPTARTEPDYFTQWIWGSSPSNHNVGKLSSVCTGLGTNPTFCTSSGYSESKSYDSDGRLSQRAIVIPNDGTFTYKWAYNTTTGLLNTLTYPTSTSGYSLQLQYAYWNGILGSITDVSDSPNATIWEINNTDAAGHVTDETFGNGIVTNRTYDAVTGWLSVLTAGVGGGSTVENQGYLYGLMGAVSQRQDNNLGLTENFNYDDDYRLTSSTLNDTQNLSISYDPMGDITSRSDVASGAAWTYGTTPLHGVTEAGSSAYTYAYDANGNASSRNGYSIGWTSYNYPTSISTATESVQFAYGPDRQRWQQNYNNGAELTNYIGALMEQVSSGGINTYRYYVYAGSEPVAVYSRTSTLVNAWNYFLLNQQGSIAAITNSSGSVVVNEDFSAYGARRNPTTWSGSPSNVDLYTIASLSRQGYTFQTALGQAVGLNHMNGRVQDAITGRFLSPDPIVQDAMNGQNYNRYSYVINNPLTFNDPTGYDWNCTVDYVIDTAGNSCIWQADPGFAGVPDTPPPYDQGTQPSTVIPATYPQPQTQPLSLPSFNLYPPPTVTPSAGGATVGTPRGAGGATPSSGAPNGNMGQSPHTNQCGNSVVFKCNQPCPNGSTPSKSNNPNLPNNIRTTAAGLFAGVTIVGAIALNIVGFPEAEVAEGGAAALGTGAAALRGGTALAQMYENAVTTNSILGAGEIFNTRNILALAGGGATLPVGVTAGILITPATCGGSNP